MSEKEKHDHSRFIATLLVLFVIGVVMYPGIVLISFLAFIPTLGALLSDRSPNYALSFCVGICNLAVSLPCFGILLNARFSLASAYEIICDPLMLLLVLGGAGAGWFIYLGVPLLTVRYYRNYDHSNLQKLQERYLQLKDNWGDNIPDSETIISLLKETDEQESQSQTQSAQT